MIELDDLGAVSAIGNLAPIGIVIALFGAIFLSLGAQFQHRGVEVVEQRHGTGAKAGLNVRQMLRLLARPSWLIGTVMLGLAILFQLTSLGFAPLIVVQPIG
ncbi:MAG: multidrug DMT transporter permease, partial [Pseudolysinimonas sp.]